MKKLFDLARKHLKSLSTEHWGVLPDEGVAILPDFQTGDLVRHRNNKRLAKFINYMHWDERHRKDYRGLPAMARIQYLNSDGSPSGGLLFGAADVLVSDLEKEELSTLAQSLENKWRLGLDGFTSDKVENASADDNQAETATDNPYASAPSSPANFNHFLGQMKNLVQVALGNTARLLTFPKFQKSIGLHAFQQKLPQLLAALNGIRSRNPDDLGEISSILESLSFYSDPANVGTGYDPATVSKEQGISGPGLYIKGLMTLLQKLKTTLEF